MTLSKLTVSTQVRTACVALSFGFFAGCAGVTDVVSTGPDTYMVASHGTMGWSSGGAQKAKAFQEADNYCKNLGKQFQSIGTKESPSGFGQIASGEVEFRCVKPDSPVSNR
ncbi:hypothetical protein [Polaromonas sp. UBA4122]|uniref:hypothetical protein n=1 Tax=Polaromonas sp. UBA4122 TaxID=1947074 RepID=UPI0025ED3050|nr:hypothetical protein [Polaromonas sp. UBA4122]